MILRKPYALLIKNFKLIHAVIAVMIGYLAYRTNNILTFINDYIGSSQLKVSTEKVNSLYSSILFVLIVFVILFTIVIMSVLRFKKKPIKFYIYNIIVHVYVLVMYIISYNLIKELVHGLVDIKTLKLVQDFTLAALGIQIIAFIIVVIRATGFDIKGFNFKEDLAELEIKEEDREEVEVSFDVDTDKLKRNLKKRLRYAKYVYLENKFIINIFLVIIFLGSVFLYLSSLNVYSKTYKESDTFKTNEFMIQVNEAYETEYDYKGNKLFDDYDLVVVRIKLRKLYGKKSKLNTGRIMLIANGEYYYHTVEYADELKDIGNTYVNSKISLTEDESYILVFKVDKANVRRKMQLRYVDTTGPNDVVKITVRPNNLNSTERIKNTKLGKTLKLKESILEDTTIKITNYELNDSFRLNYKYCPSDGECYDAIEYVNVSASDNYSKTLLKLDGKMKLDSDLPISRYSSLFQFIKQFVTIKYTKNSESRRIIAPLKEVKPYKVKSENTYFIEVPSVLKDAEQIVLEINVRNKVYNYTLK